ncbi:hypothetical protein G3260_006198 [Streptomyces albus]|nr:hypothetical protein G3260_006198 [Streptomyces albus]
MEPHLLTARSALVLLLALLTGVGAAVLAVWAGSGLPQSLLCGAGSTGLAVGFFDRLVGPDPAGPRTHSRRTGGSRG